MSIAEIDTDHPFLDYEKSIFPHLKGLDEPTLADLYERVERIREMRWGLQGGAIVCAALALKTVVSGQFMAAGCFILAALVSAATSTFFHKPPPYLILSIDGGGMRGMIPIQILAHIEEELGVPIGKVFDCIAGTSIGGILALALSQPDPNDKTVPKMNAAQVCQFLESQGPIVFERGTLQTIKSVEGLRGPKYTNDNIKNILEQQFGDTHLDQATTDILIPSYDLHQRRPAVFFHFKGQDPQKPLLMRDIGVATAAAPIYFPSHAIDDLNLVDGGVFANNPALLAYMKAAGHIDPNRDIYILSLGTGQMPHKPIPSHQSENYGMIQWLPMIFDLIFQSNQEMLTLQFKLIKHVGEVPLTLVRIQPELHKASQEQLDNTTPSNIASLKKIATRYFELNIGWLQRELIQPLLKYRIAAPTA